MAVSLPEHERNSGTAERAENPPRGTVTPLHPRLEGAEVERRTVPFTRGWARRRSYPVFGAVLALGAPAGLLALRATLARDVRAVVVGAGPARRAGVRLPHASTLTVFILLGRVLGKKEDLLEASSTTDGLTGLANRRHFDARLGGELARAARHGGPLALVLADVDGLKAINDQGGHEAGDDALRAVGEALRESCRRTDVPARVGGDEFAVLAPVTTAEQAVELANRIRETLASLPGRRKAPTISVGVADTARIASASPEALYAAADRALYAAKAAGRDRVVRAGP